MTISITDITLDNIYTNATSTEHSTSVYANGKMQVVVFPSVTYNGTESIDAVTQYVYDHTNLFYIDGVGESHPVTWTRSDVSNEYLHDIYNGVESEAEAKTITSDIRIPIYFTVPYAATGNYKWVAQLSDGTDTQWTSTDESEIVNISAEMLSISEDKIEIYDMKKVNLATLRVIRYVAGSFPATHQLLEMASDFYGIDFTPTHHLRLVGAWGRGSGSKAAGFLIGRPSASELAGGGVRIAYSNTQYYTDISSVATYYHFTDYGLSDEDAHFQHFASYDNEYNIIRTDDSSHWEDLEASNIVTEQEYQNALNLGVICVKYEAVDMYFNWSGGTVDGDVWAGCGDLKMIDNYGNIIKFNMNWDYGINGEKPDWHHNWKVIDPVVVAP
ncbi:hypothetical protein [Shewanella sp. YLB-07]|uniref:hypothetical protein n=1 Tax=Shewanella sp. YLB-07 TaxID=2601268 RepID=UPI00128E87AA|nr:hypothetical protein [Shewanella sp. YLB-07]MPY26896.1 hypothetical protein [Shewanella sp. YLB-07]